MDERDAALPFHPTAAILAWSGLLARSFRHWLGRELVSPAPGDEALARALYEAPWVVVSHGTEADPVLNYGNRAALALWDTDWTQFTRTPSRLTAEADLRQARAAVMARVAARGYTEGYRGVRVTLRGRRFAIEDAVVWNVVDATGRRLGQAATFAQWSYL